MFTTHGPNTQTKNSSNVKETRKNIGTIPANERFHIGEPNVPVLVLHLRFVNDGSGRIRIILSPEVKNVKVVYLDSLYVDLPDAGLFSVGVRFTKGVDYFYPDVRPGSNITPDYTIWNHPIYENTVLGTGRYVIIDEKMRTLKSYRSGTTFSNVEVSVVNENGAAVPWTEITMDLRCETMDWQ